VAILLDTQILIAWINRDFSLIDHDMREAMDTSNAAVSVSVVSLWEIAIKSRLGKLPLAMSLQSLPSFIVSLQFGLLVIDHRHVLAAVNPEPATRDPFDRLLLGQCAAEGLRLMTLDRAMLMHPLAWRK
jgi:PIN domain nuclease of toxin-antitoxin system